MRPLALRAHPQALQSWAWPEPGTHRPAAPSSAAASLDTVRSTWCPGQAERSSSSSAIPKTTPKKDPKTVCIPNRRQLAVSDFETSNSLVFARILPQANQLIGVKYSETLHIPLLLMKRPLPPARLRTQSTHRPLPLRRAQNYNLRKSRGLQPNPGGFQARTLKHCKAFGCLGLGNCKTLLLNQILEVFILFGASCL